MSKYFTVIHPCLANIRQRINDIQDTYARHLWAFVSLVVHGVVLIVLLNGSHGKGGLNVDAPGKGKSATYLVSYSRSDRQDLPTSRKALAERSIPLRKTRHQTENVHIARSDDEVAGGSKKIPAFSIVKPEPRYFASKELTQLPAVIWDAPSGLALAAFDVPTQAARLHILINEYGDVDRVVVEDSSLSTVDQAKVVDAFLKSKFLPGKIGRIPVKSEVKVEVTLEDLR